MTYVIQTFLNDLSEILVVSEDPVKVLRHLISKAFKHESAHHPC